MITRRRLIAGTTVASLMGVTAGAIGANYSRGIASIRFLGWRESMLVLIDSGKERSLILLGEQNDDLLARIPGLSTVGNQRIDLVIATHRSLASRMAREHLHIERVQTICLQANQSVAPLRGNIIATTESIGIRLGESTSINVHPLGIGSMAGLADHPDFMIEVDRDSTRILLGSSNNVFRRAASPPANLVAVPGVPDDIVPTSSGCQTIVCNTKNTELTTAVQMQVNSTDPVVARFKNGSIAVNRYQVSS